MAIEGMPNAETLRTASRTARKPRASRPVGAVGGVGGFAEARRKYPGALVVVEGIDGSGKSTQLYLLQRWLEIGGYRIHFTEWDSSPPGEAANRPGKRARH